MKNYPKPIMFYHSPCPDGFGAAFSFWMKYGNRIEYVPIQTKNEPFRGIPFSIFMDRKIWMVDISLQRNDAIAVAEVAKDFTIIDHHMSAIEDLQGLDFCQMSLKNSGAVLAWNYCFPDKPIPKIISYVEDRDLWKWQFPYTKEILAVLDCQDKDFNVWEKFNHQLDDPEKFAKLVQSGQGILKQNQFLMNWIVAQTQSRMNIKGFEVPVVNTPFFRSEILHELAVNEPFAAAFHFDGEQFIFSLRSNDEDGLNVAEIAKSFPGGGGHYHAAGFRVKNLDEIKGDKNAK